MQILLLPLTVLLLQYPSTFDLRDVEGDCFATCIYSSSTYMSDEFIHYQPDSAPEFPTHAVAIVGWNDTLETGAPQPGAWLCRNSWGALWGTDSPGICHGCHRSLFGFTRRKLLPDKSGMAGLLELDGQSISGHRKLLHEAPWFLDRASCLP